jgi:hypothetical protein
MEPERSFSQMCGGIGALSDRYRRLFDLVENQLVMVVEMYALD